MHTSHMKKLKAHIQEIIKLNVNLNDPMEMRALKEALGPVGMVRFMQQYDSGHGNYTEERKRELDLDMDEIDELLGL